jgi:lysozyme family protein
MGYDNDYDGDIDINDLKLLTDEQAFQIMKRGYWDRWKADLIQNQSVAEQLVDWVWGSGVWGIKIPQRTLNVVSDGIVGDKTIEAVNNYNQKDIHFLIKQDRIAFINGIIQRDPTQKRFIKGWLNRINSFTFKP